MEWEKKLLRTQGREQKMYRTDVCDVMLPLSEMLKKELKSVTGKEM